MVPDVHGKSAVTRWRIAAVRDGRALALFTPETGRTHQIRVHAAHGLGVPIVGDPVYGRVGRPPSPGPMLLHSRALRLDRDGKAAIEATAPMPPTFAKSGFSDADL
jgi:tRNA pseudouridine32 synthase/23S rRNA pseudouridine746 synthase